MLTLPLALRARALSVEAAGSACCWQQQSRQGWKEGGGMCYRGGLAAASRVTEGIAPRGLLFPRLQLALLQQKRHWLSVTSSQATTGLFVRMYLSCPGNSDTFRKEMFFLNILY